MRGEGLGRCASGDGLHHGRFHLDVGLIVEVIPDFSNDLTAFEEDLFHLQIRHQIQIALTIPDFGVFQSMPLFGGGSQCLAKGYELIDFDGNFSHLGREHLTFHADEIGHVHRFE